MDSSYLVWHQCEDAAKMTKALAVYIHDDLKQYLRQKLQQYYVATCRDIWELIPLQGSRNGVDSANRYINGLATYEELMVAERGVESAAYFIAYNNHPLELSNLVSSIDKLPKSQLRNLLNPPRVLRDISTAELLRRAAFFVEFAVNFVLEPKSQFTPSRAYQIFLSAAQLRSTVDLQAFGLGEDEMSQLQLKLVSFDSEL